MSTNYRFLLCLFALGWGAQVTAQNLSVIAVRGAVKSKKIGKTIRTGDLLPPDDALTFRDASDMLSLVSAEGQRLTVVYPAKRFKKSKVNFDLASLVQNAPAGLVPQEPVFKTPEEAKLYFSQRPFLFLGQETRIKMPKGLFPQSRALFFYMNYDYKNDNIDKKIEYKGDTMVLAKRALFKIDGKEVDGKFAENFSFYYYNQPKTKHTFLGKMTPYFPVDERLKEETDILVKILETKNATGTAIYQEVAGFMLSHYGTVVGSDFLEWMKVHYPKIAYVAPPPPPPSLTPATTPNQSVKN
jgi:hypothetical protein